MCYWKCKLVKAYITLSTRPLNLWSKGLLRHFYKISTQSEQAQVSAGSGTFFGIHGGGFFGKCFQRQFFWDVLKWVGGRFFDSTRRQNWLLPCRGRRLLCNEMKWFIFLFSKNKKAYISIFHDYRLLAFLKNTFKEMFRELVKWLRATLICFESLMWPAGQGVFLRLV